jgi:hypothetical protein
MDRAEVKSSAFAREPQEMKSASIPARYFGCLPSCRRGDLMAMVIWQMVIRDRQRSTTARRGEIE